MSCEGSGTLGKALKTSREDEDPPEYSPLEGSKTRLSLTQMSLHGETGFPKTVSESFRLANTRGYLRKCSRCEARIPDTAYDYSCPKCIAETASVSHLCQKCAIKIPKCRTHQKDLIQRALKAWPAAPPYIDYISPTATKLENPLVHALITKDDGLTALHARDSNFLHCRGYLGYTPLHLAAYLGLVSGATILLVNGALTNIRDDRNLTPLLTAIELDQPQIVSLLLDHGANIHSICGYRDTTALHAAAANGFPTLVSLLLEKGAMVDTPSGRGTALQLACRIGSVSCASVLLEKGANPNVRSEGVIQEAPIIMAARNNDAEMVDLLVKFGADVDLTPLDEKESFTAFTVAVAYGFSELEKRLLKYGADAGNRFKWGAKANIYGQISGLGL